MDHKTSSREPEVLVFCKRLSSDTRSLWSWFSPGYVGRSGVLLFMLRAGRPLSASQQACCSAETPFMRVEDFMTLY
jgi:hypothetical protein